ncbi:MAG TPA: hypothetical protein VJ826_04270 [Candidatus Polarisedimenticolaceae bacterium]|nr:hypothetical protein [Candidatus Polarisedimenticolaceae bacterium]
MRLHDKLEGIHRLDPDVLVVPECACPQVLLRRVPGLAPASMVWSGRSPSKGLAVISFGCWRVATSEEHDARGLTTIAATVRGPFDFRLAAVWAVAGAVEPLPRALERLGPFLSAGPSAVAGDFNDTLAPRGPVLHQLGLLGFDSAYHRLRRVSFGGEREPTLYLRRREGLRRHRDLVFLDATLAASLRAVEVGSKEFWSRASDHVPVVAVIDASALVP